MLKVGQKALWSQMLIHFHLIAINMQLSVWKLYIQFTYIFF